MSDRFDDIEAEDEIVLSSGAGLDTLQFDAADYMPARVNHEYVQVNPIKGITHSLAIFDDVYLSETISGFKKKKSVKRIIDLTYLDTVPERHVHIDWPWFYGAMGATAWAFVLIYIGVFTEFTIAGYSLLPYGILLGTFGLVAFLIFFYRSNDRLIYKSYIGRIPMFQIFNKHRQDEFQEFIKQLKKHIHLAQHNKGLNMQQRLSGEVKELRRQVNAGKVGSEDYERARDRIFKHESFSGAPGPRTN